MSLIVKKKIILVKLVLYFKLKSFYVTGKGTLQVVHSRHIGHLENTNDKIIKLQIIKINSQNMIQAAVILHSKISAKSHWEINKHY